MTPFLEESAPGSPERTGAFRNDGELNYSSPNLIGLNGARLRTGAYETSDHYKVFACLIILKHGISDVSETLLRWASNDRIKVTNDQSDPRDDSTKKAIEGIVRNVRECIAEVTLRLSPPDRHHHHRHHHHRHLHHRYLQLHRLNVIERHNDVELPSRFNSFRVPSNSLAPRLVNKVKNILDILQITFRTIIKDTVDIHTEVLDDLQDCAEQLTAVDMSELAHGVLWPNLDKVHNYALDQAKLAESVCKSLRADAGSCSAH